MGAAVPVIPGEEAPHQAAQALQRHVAEILNCKPSQFPGAQPVSFSRHHITEKLCEHDFYVCEKSDGIRCLMFLTEEDGAELAYLITRKNEYFWVPDLHFPSSSNFDSHHRETIIDGELVVSKSTGELKYLIFDCLALDGLLLTERTLDKRLGHLQSGFFKPYQAFMRAFPNEKFAFQVHLKDMEFSYALPKIFNEIIPKLDHVTDGLIFTSRESNYVFGTDEDILKWKPAEENTVDFRLVLSFPIYEDEDLPEDDPDRRYPDYDATPEFILDVWTGGRGVRDAQYRQFDTLFVTPEEWEKLKALNEPLDHRIIECYKDKENRWRYMRFRDDKETANHISVVEKVQKSISDGVSKEELLAVWPKIRENWKRRQAESHEAKKRRVG